MSEGYTRIIISTTGISILIKFGLSGKEYTPATAPREVDSTLFEQLRGAVWAGFSKPDRGENAIDSLVQLMRLCYPALPHDALPAEITSLTFKEIGVNPTDLLIFVAGGSRSRIADKGEICAKALVRYFEQECGIDAQYEQIRDFVVVPDEHGEKHMPKPQELLHRLEEIIGREQRANAGASVVINLTAGYKVGAIFAAIVGLMHNCEVYYSHEEMRVPYGLFSQNATGIGLSRDEMAHLRRALNRASQTNWVWLRGQRSELPQGGLTRVLHALKLLSPDELRRIVMTYAEHLTPPEDNLYARLFDTTGGTDAKITALLEYVLTRHAYHILYSAITEHRPDITDLHEPIYLSTSAA